ncbi:putative spermidine/putrescine transport system permease protein [Amycolatopsis xylanica]|uniref:Putative spermidine/putrescine transport system permease protein n=1 Tax=Amycolatopsis xylanica TaxID=589385 RepID=A0A1H3NM92_9PSEU|nr:ABC transporter permease subunit [Amycolatopsis xylanica]SDY90067.1 putative spermidine/putrescine transport system permease protein [Amycolatopsis xylanica]
MSKAFRWLILSLFGLYFLVPLAASVEFSLRDVNDTHSFNTWGKLLDEPGLFETLGTSLWVAFGTVALTLILMVPTVSWVHLKHPKLRRLVEGVSLLPLVIPPIVLVNGVLVVFRDAPEVINGTPVILVFEYVVLALPFTYRTLDAGLQAIALPTLVEAARSLGASWTTVLLRVIIPNIRSAVFGAAFLNLALVLGEYTLASILLMNTFPVWTVSTGQSEAGVSVAVSLLALFVAFLLLFVLSVVTGRRKATLGATQGKS